MGPQSFTRRTVVVLVLVAAVTPLSADGLKGVLRALEKGDYTEARQKLTALAEKGDEGARQAMALLEPSSGGFANARVALARIYADGRLVKQDRVRALFYAAGAASGGDHPGQTLVDTLVADLTPQEVERAIAEAERSYRAGEYSEAVLVSKVYAHRGERSSQVRLGRMYALAFGVPQNFTEAYKWLRLGYEDDPDHWLLDRIRNELSPEEIASVESIVERWQPFSWKSADEERTAREIPGQNGVSLPIFRGKKRPVYPEPARLGRLQGRVIIRAVITSDGKVVLPHVLECTAPHKQFEESALESVSHWLYDPAMKDGVPVEVEFTLIVEFSLR